MSACVDGRVFSLKRYRQPPTELLRRYRTGQSAKKGRDKKKTQEPGVV